VIRDILIECISREKSKAHVASLVSQLKFRSLTEIFNLIQEDNIDFVSLKEFREVMMENSILLEKNDLRYLIKKYEK
jgi:hypothetical protein